MEIRNKVVLITGASAGIGLATARRFGQAGAKLALAARSTDRLETLAHEMQSQGIEAIALTTDLRDPAQIQQAISTTARHYGRIDILINNAGQAVAGTIADLDPDHFHQVIELNVYAPLHAMQAVIPIMRVHGGGIIINVSSMVSKMRIPGLAGYAATKSALNMMSDTARGELANDNIRVISVFPRLTSTDFQQHSLGSQETRRQQRAPHPSVPIDPPEHVAEKILLAAEHEPEEQYMDR